MAETEGAIQPAKKAEATPSADQELDFFARIAQFFRQVVDEMKKVVYPTREELWRYFLVVIVFVAIIMAAVGLMDLGFGALTDLIFS